MTTKRNYRGEQMDPSPPPLPTTPFFKPPPPPPSESIDTTNGYSRSNGYSYRPPYEASTKTPFPVDNSYYTPDASTFMHIPPPSLRHHQPPPPIPQIISRFGPVQRPPYNGVTTPSALNGNYRNNFYAVSPSGENTSIPPPDIYNPHMGRQHYRPPVPGNRNFRPPFYQNRKQPNKNSPQPTKPSKKKRKTIAENVPSTRSFDLKLAEAALKVEQEHSLPTRQLVLRFPDPPITREIIHGLHPAIQKIHFQHPCSPRYCFIQFSEDTDTNAAIEKLNNTDFGTGKLKVELKQESNGKYYDRRNDKPEQIDPFILFVGNIGHNTPAEAVKQLFHPGRVDIGLSQKMKNSRYAYIRFANAQDAIETFKRTQGAIIGDHSLNVRFRRLNGSVHCPSSQPEETSTKPQIEEAEEPPKEDNKQLIHQELGLVIKKEEEDDDYSNYIDEPEIPEEIDLRLKEELMMDYGRDEEDTDDSYPITSEMQEEQGSLDRGLSKELSRFADRERSQFLPENYPEVPTIKVEKDADPPKPVPALDPGVQVKQEIGIDVSIPFEKLQNTKSRVNKAITNFLK